MKIYKPSELIQFLSELGIAPKKGLSQNFLIDGNIIRKIVSTAPVELGDVVVEIGPGPGALTEALLEAGATVIAVEKDAVLAKALKRIKGNLHVYCDDIQQFPIEENDTFGEVEKKLLEVGSKALLEIIQQFDKGKVTETPQNHELMTLAPKIELEDCEIHWCQPAQTIHNLVRGVNPYPGAWCEVMEKGQKKRLKIYSTRVQKGISGNPGEILSIDNTGMVIACGEDGLKILELQLEGKKRMPPSELLRGTSIEFKHE